MDRCAAARDDDTPMTTARPYVRQDGEVAALAYAAFGSVAISITNRYFTSLFSIRA